MILHIGCGENDYGDVLMDILPPIGYKKKFIKHSAEEPLPFKDNEFDEVFSQMLIEHLRNPDDFIAECCRVAKKKVTIITDNCEYIGRIYYRQFTNIGSIRHPEHKYSWSLENFTNLIDASCKYKYNVFLANTLSRKWARRITSILPIKPNLKYGAIHAQIFPSVKRKSKNIIIDPKWNNRYIKKIKK